MALPDLRLVRIIARRLTSALELREEARADKQIDRIMRRALRSHVHMESTFAAVQALRDLRVIDRDEAAYLFYYILDLLQWRLFGTPRVARMHLDTPDDFELLDAAMTNENLVETEKFYRSRG